MSDTARTPATGLAADPENGPENGVTTATRQRLALAQTALLSALVAGTPVPEGFDRGRIGVQSRALAAKRADVTAKVAPELPRILGDRYRPAFLRYAAAHPLEGGYRLDALRFAEHVLAGGAPGLDGTARGLLDDWWRERSGPAPLSAAARSGRSGPLGRFLGLLGAARTALAGR